MLNRSITRRSRNTSAITISKWWRGRWASCTAKKNCGRTRAAAHSYGGLSSPLRHRSKNEPCLNNATPPVRQTCPNPFCELLEIQAEHGFREVPLPLGEGAAKRRVRAKDRPSSGPSGHLLPVGEGLAVLDAPEGLPTWPGPYI